MTDIIEEIHAFWFGELDSQGRCMTDRHTLWFGADAATDEACRERFGDHLSTASDGGLQNWTHTDRGLIALIVLLDQFSRNIHRGSAGAFAGDPLALTLARNAIDSGRHLQLPAIHQVFLYLPLEHSEDLAVQEDCVALFTALERANHFPEFASFTRFAVAHRDVIATFGRFPHRNSVLGRQSSAEELEYLEQHGGF